MTQKMDEHFLFVVKKFFYSAWIPPADGPPLYPPVKSIINPLYHWGLLLLWSFKVSPPRARKEGLRTKEAHNTEERGHIVSYRNYATGGGGGRGGGTLLSSPLLYASALFGGAGHKRQLFQPSETLKLKELSITCHMIAKYCVQSSF